jgi:hypothetical protein
MQIFINLFEENKKKEGNQASFLFLLKT